MLHGTKSTEPDHVTWSRCTWEHRGALIPGTGSGRQYHGEPSISPPWKDYAGPWRDKEDYYYYYYGGGGGVRGSAAHCFDSSPGRVQCSPAAVVQPQGEQQLLLQLLLTLWLHYSGGGGSSGSSA